MMEEYALNSFPEIASKDPLRMLDLGNDAQILYDMVRGNETGETDRAEKNILHALGEPYKPGEVFFNVVSNVSPLVAGAIINSVHKAGKSAAVGVKKALKASKPYYYVKDGKILTPAGRVATSQAAKNIKDVTEGAKFSKFGNKAAFGGAMKEGLKSAGNVVKKSAIEGAGAGALVDGLFTFPYKLTRPKSSKMSYLKGMILSLLNADIEDPARFNKDDVELAYQIMYGDTDELPPPREMISQIRTGIRENPEYQKEILEAFKKRKEELKNENN